MAGIKGKSGRKTLASEMGLKRLLDSAWSLAERRKVIRKMNEVAQKGNVKAATLLMAYAYGKPKEQIEITDKRATVLSAIEQHRKDYPDIPEDLRLEWFAEESGIDKTELVSEANN